MLTTSNSCMASWAVVVALCFLAPLCRADLYALGNFPISQDRPPMDLYSVNGGNGNTTLIGSTGIAHFFGMTFGPNNILYGATENRLYSIDLATGIADLVTQSPTIATEGALAYQLGSSLLFFQSARGNLATYDLNSGDSAFVTTVNPPTQSDISAAAFSTTGIYFVLSRNRNFPNDPLVLYSVDLASGDTSLVLDTGILNDGIGGLAFDSPSTGFITNGSDFYRFDLVAGETRLLGTLPNPFDNRYSALAYTIPEPSTLAVFAVLCLSGFACDRRCSCLES